jgi:Zn-dependent M28 family amino/carboxypeptidase
MAGRAGGTEGEAETALYLANFLQERGLKPAGEGETYFQTFSLKEYAPKKVGERMTFAPVSSTEKGSSANVLGLLEGRKKEVIIVSAHYDHLGMINGQLYPGANDNASGVSAVLEIIAGLVEKGKPEKTLLFTFWGSEEKGLIGSKYFCTHPTLPLEQIKCIVNFDSLGNLTSKKLLLGWQDEENELTKEITEKLAEDGWQINWKNDSGHSSDHFSFSQKKVPGFTLLSPDWLKNNHTPLDTVTEIRTAPLRELVLSFIDILK